MESPADTLPCGVKRRCHWRVPGYQITVYERRAHTGGIWALDDLGHAPADPATPRQKQSSQPEDSRWPATLVFDKYGDSFITWSRAAAAVARGRRSPLTVDSNAEQEELRRRPPGAIYNGLRTNVASDLMSYRDKPFPEETPLFPERGQVLEYLQSVGQALGMETSLPGAVARNCKASASMTNGAVPKRPPDNVDLRFLTRVKALYRSVAGQGSDTDVDGLKPGTKWTIVSEPVLPGEEETVTAGTPNTPISPPTSSTSPAAPPTPSAPSTPSTPSMPSMPSTPSTLSTPTASTVPTTGGERVDEFDHVIVASGRCNTPALPFIPGLWNFRGKVLHSAWYRTPYPFAHLNVVVVGNASSGFDICRELVGKVTRTLPIPQPWERNSSPFTACLSDTSSPEAVTAAWIAGCGTEAYGGRTVQSVFDYDRPPGLDFDPRDPTSPAWARRIRVVPRIDHIDPPDEGGGRSTGKIYFSDGRCLEDVDVIIFATGYHYDFPFLDQTKPPFDKRPLIPRPPPRTAMVEDGIPDGHFAQETTSGYKNAVSPRAVAQLREYIDKYQGGRPFHRRWPTVPALQNMDEWQLFYRYDESLAFLGMPLRIVPFPLTQVQSRYLAQYWAGLSNRLTKLDPNVPPNDVHRWAYRPAPIPRAGQTWKQADAAARSRIPDAPPNNLAQHDIGTPSDIRYQEALIRHICPVAEPQYAPSTNGLGDGSPRLPERWDVLVPLWRQERRANGKLLRRRELGF